MRRLGYFLIKIWVSVGLFCYYKKIRVWGSDNIPKEKPVLFLSNHQNALMDVLLIATRCQRTPWFLTRSDVFKNPVLQSIFRFLQMLPVYRMRDGKSNLIKNNETFEQCGRILAANGAILLFPEANHSLQRRVRPLSKGFTRIILAALRKDPNLDLQLVPIGQNYGFPRAAGDTATLYFGMPIPAKKFVHSEDFANQTKEAVFKSLVQLTTHIPEADQETTIQRLGKDGSVYLNPIEVNAMIAQGTFENNATSQIQVAHQFLRTVFLVFNVPIIVLWRTFIKPKVPEAEFMATFRFGFALVAYPIAYGLTILLLWNFYDAKTACLTILGHAVFNMILIKTGITSSVQRK